MIPRTLQSKLQQKLHGGKAILLTGPRQVGKTTLIQAVLRQAGLGFQHLNADDPSVRELLTNPNMAELRQILGKPPILFVDEAQRIPNIGLTAKLITDEFPGKQLVLSGSSSFELNASTQEPLTGRKWTYELFPISWAEWEAHLGYVKAEQELETCLVLGMYPEVLMHPAEREERLLELVDSYLYKDVWMLGGIRKPRVLQKLVQALAAQIGQQVVYSEVARVVGIDPKTVREYMDVLEQAYVLFRLPAFSRNLRTEIKKSRKVYFYDNGVRNAVLGNLRAFSSRQDRGQLWENFLVSERRKLLAYHGSRAKMHFWRTKQQQEVDYVEDSGEELRAFEFTWAESRKKKIPETFQRQYGVQGRVIQRSNFRSFVFPPGAGPEEA